MCPDLEASARQRMGSGDRPAGRKSTLQDVKRRHVAAEVLSTWIVVGQLSAQAFLSGRGKAVGLSRAGVG